MVVCGFSSDDTEQWCLYLKGHIYKASRLAVFLYLICVRLRAWRAFDIQYFTPETDRACRAHFCRLFLCVSPDNNLKQSVHVCFHLGTGRQLLIKSRLWHLTLLQWLVLTQASHWAAGYRGYSRQPPQTGGSEIVARYEYHGADARRNYVTGHPGGRSLCPCWQFNGTSHRESTSQ